MKYKEFLKITDNLDRNKYHTCCSIKEDMENCDWVIYRKDMSMEEYFSPENKPLLSSETHTKEDLIEFCRRCNI